MGRRSLSGIEAYAEGECGVSISRNPLVNRRPTETFELKSPDFPSVSVSFGYYPDGRIGEVFVTSRKIGTQFDAECSDAAVMLSVALQHGISPSSLYHSMHRTEDGRPVSVMGHILVEMIRLYDA